MIIRSKAPLRLGLGGGGTDLEIYANKYTGYVLNATISLYTYTTIEPLSNGKIIFHSLDTNEYIEIESQHYLHFNGKMDLYKAIYNKIIKYFYNTPLSFKLSTYSDVPIGSGLGGSSTMVVSIINAFVKWLNLPLSKFDIAKLAYEIERKDVKIIGGAQDQYAAAFGGFNFIEFHKNEKVIINPLKIPDWIINELEMSTILYFTGVKRNASIIEKEKESVLKKEASLKAMHQIKQDALSMKKYILQGKIKKLAKVLNKSWESKKSINKVISNTIIDNIYNLALNNGAYGGKISGAGGGGFMFFLVNPTKKFHLINLLNQQGGKVFNFNFEKKGVQGWKI